MMCLQLPKATGKFVLRIPFWFTNLFVQIPLGTEVSDFRRYCSQVNFSKASNSIFVALGSFLAGYLSLKEVVSSAFICFCEYK